MLAPQGGASGVAAGVVIIDNVHRHIGEQERLYAFTTQEQLLADFWQDVQRWRGEA